MDLKEAIGAIIAGVVLLLPAMKWLINDWSKKATELEELRKKNATDALDTLKKVVDGLASDIRTLRTTLDRQTMRLKIFEDITHRLKEQLEKTLAEIDRVKNTAVTAVKEEVRTQIIQLSKDLAMIKDKKNGQS